MQGKGLIKFVAIALTIACVYSLSFTWVAKQVESDAKAYAKGDPLKEQAYLDSIATQPVYFNHYTYQYVKEREMQLGLDLKGGMNVTMEISLTQMVHNLANNTADANFNAALRNANTLLVTSHKDYITLFGEEYAKLSPDGQLAPFFSTKENDKVLKQNASNSDVLAFLQKEAKSAIERSYNILGTRIDKFGVSAPNIQMQEGANRILIELPGILEQDADRVRKLLEGSAKLEFWETYNNTEIFSLLENVDKVLASTQKAHLDTVKTPVAAKTTAAKDTSAGKLAGLGAKKDSSKTDTSKAGQSLAEQSKLHPLFAKLIPATYQDEKGQQSLRPGPVVGFTAQKDTAEVNRLLSLPESKSIIPQNLKLLWGVKPMSAESKVYELYAIKPKADGSPALAGDVVTNAREDFDQRGNPEVVMIMNTDGARQWRQITAAAAADVNNKKSIAIVLDDAVYSAPTVQNEIPNGISSISGNFTVNDTKDLANVLKAGRLPAPAKIMSEQIVGPSLGEKAIHDGLISCVVGLVVVLIFMIIYYNRAGTVANVAVFVNIFFLIGVLASIHAVLTLPGIAGIVLTMGMAVDANVLIYERVREELKHGKSLRLAIADGYKHALSSILDGNITTFLTGVILYVFGTGAIQGFAVTLMIGILTSLFCAIFISRLVFEWLLGKNQDISFSHPWSSHTFQNANFQFVKNRKIFYIISGVFITAGLISMYTRGFSLGVDFQGGRTYIVRFDKPVDPENVRVTMDEEFDETTEVKTFGPSNQVKITTSYLINQNTESTDKSVQAKLEQGLKKVGNNGQVMDYQKVGPTIASDLKRSAIWSVIFAIIIIAGYIFIRFRKWQFSLGALVATAHDSLLVLSFFSLFHGYLPFSLDVDQNFIAAILTVIGYSINDTVVVFDRIREYLNLHHSKADDPKNVINQAINSTLSRTTITALTVLFVLIVLFIFGGEVLRGFSFALLIGVVFGTYSSIFVASPVIIDFGKKDLR
jgi:SecD/SecF fusion protein